MPRGRTAIPITQSTNHRTEAIRSEPIVTVAGPRLTLGRLRTSEDEENYR